MSELRKAVRITANLIDKRTARFRNLVICVVAVGIASLVSAVIFLSARPLLALAAILPLCVVFILCDILLVNRWREKILSMWASGDLDPAIYCQTLSVIRSLPPKSVKGLTDTLSPIMNQACPDHADADCRKTISHASKILNRCHAVRSAGLGLCASLCALSLILATIGWFMASLAGLLAAMAAHAAHLIVIQMEIRSLGKAILSDKSVPSASASAVVDILKSLDWTAAGEQRKKHFLDKFASGAQAQSRGRE